MTRLLRLFAVMATVLSWPHFAGAADPCPAGSFGPGKPSCTQAPRGTFAAAGSVQATPCPLGSYSSQPGAVSCIAAPAGTYAIMGATDKRDCSIGYYCPAGSSPGTVGKCPAGFTSPVGATSSSACVAAASPATVNYSAYTATQLIEIAKAMNSAAPGTNPVLNFIKGLTPAQLMAVAPTFSAAHVIAFAPVLTPAVLESLDATLLVRVVPGLTTPQLYGLPDPKLKIATPALTTAQFSALKTALLVCVDCYFSPSFEAILTKGSDYAPVWKDLSFSEICIDDAKNKRRFIDSFKETGNHYTPPNDFFCKYSSIDPARSEPPFNMWGIYKKYNREADNATIVDKPYGVYFGITCWQTGNRWTSIDRYADPLRDNDYIWSVGGISQAFGTCQSTRPSNCQGGKFQDWMRPLCKRTS